MVTSGVYEGVGTLARMAAVEPFRAVRYSGAAGSLADLVAPPYDAVGPEERERLRSRSPYNVVHLTLPESAEEAGGLYREWLADGILAHEAEPAAWLLSEGFTGPDGIARERRGVVVSLSVEPYETKQVLPHERTHSRIREERLRLLRAVRVQPEPILVLQDEPLELEDPARAPDLQTDGSRVWRLEDFDPGSPGTDGFLIADGHHRYESALELGAGARIMALLVSTTDPGLHVFPTHRTFSGRPDLAEAARRRERRGASPQASRFPREASLERGPRPSRTGGERVSLIRGARGRARRRAGGPLRARGHRVHVAERRSRRRSRPGRCGRRVPAARAPRRRRVRGCATGRAHASEEHVLLPEAPVGTSLPPGGSSILNS